MPTTAFNIKFGEIKKIIPGVGGLVKKTDYNAKTSDTEAKYFNVSDYNKFTVKKRISW